MRAFIAVAMLFAATIPADAARWIRANLYFRGWHSERYVALSPDGLRDEARHGYSRSANITSASQLQQLVAVLDLSRTHTMQGDIRGDTNLVVDLFDSGGARTTYRADNRYLWNADCTRGREVDEHFRKFFERIVPNRSNQSMKPIAPLRNTPSAFATTPCGGLSLSR